MTIWHAAREVHPPWREAVLDKEAVIFHRDLAVAAPEISLESEWA